MRFDENVRLDTSQVEDRRGRGGFAPSGGGVVVGGGMGLLLLLVAMLFGLNPSEAGPHPAPNGSIESSPAPGAAASEGSLQENCRVGADANVREDCQVVGLVNSIQEYWGAEFSRRGYQYARSRTRLFTGGTQSGCGFASSAAGPFYFPLDDMVYVDLDFFDELRQRFGARGGPFARAYVLAHEYGHHVQDLQGTLARARSGASGPQSEAVRIELQADCFAGLWARHAVSTGYISRLTQEDIAVGLDAAAAVGDDRIQQRTQGQVRPESWTHGSAQQRQQWFLVGYESGELTACTTFSGRV